MSRSQCSIGNAKLAMFKRNPVIANENFFIVADFLNRMGLKQALEVFLAETGAKVKHWLTDCEDPDDSALAKLVLWQLANPETKPNDYMPGLLEKLGWADDSEGCSSDMV